MNGLTPNLKSQAYHEAGHVVFGLRGGKRLQNVAIGIGENQKAGCATWDITLLPEGELTLEQIKPDCVNFLAGHVVEDWFAPSSADDYSSHYLDHAEVTKLLRRVPNASEEEYKNLWSQEIREALKLEDVKNAIQAVAERLLVVFEISGEEAATLVRAHIIENR